jgi:hypothetical protein
VDSARCYELALGERFKDMLLQDTRAADVLI